MKQNNMNYGMRQQKKRETDKNRMPLMVETVNIRMRMHGKRENIPCWFISHTCAHRRSGKSCFLLSLNKKLPQIEKSFRVRVVKDKLMSLFMCVHKLFGLFLRFYSVKQQFISVCIFSVKKKSAT